MTDNREGQVVTFYSYKGGTGRTMALANVAWILAANGKRVLVVDWDLESPGLHRFFAPFINSQSLSSTSGVIELIHEYEWISSSGDSKSSQAMLEQYASVHKYSFNLNWNRFPGSGTLDFLSAGQQNSDYAAMLSGMNWDDFYQKQNGGTFFDALRADMKRKYDFTLIDSRTGLSDVADICTIQLPDILVDCFTLSEQGIEGASRVARQVSTRYRSRHIRILPVPMRVDPAEKNKMDAGLRVAQQRFAGLPADMSEAERQAYWNGIKVPYQAYYAYEESLATFGDRPGSSDSLLKAYENLTAQITSGEVQYMPPIDDATRTAIMGRFERRPIAVEEEIVLRYAPEDLSWAEWIEHVLISSGIRVYGLAAFDDDRLASSGARTLTIVSTANVADEAVITTPDSTSGRPPLAVYVSDVMPLPNVPLAASAFFSGLAMEPAAERLLELVGRRNLDLDKIAGSSRFPGNDSEIFNVPARNARFTGREQELRELRAQLRTRTAVVLSGVQPIALQGMGGIGKTQLATEYAHRFRASYDIVWWISAEPVADIDDALVDLGTQLGITAVPSVAENARAVVQHLARSRKRWLLILDNAEDPDEVGRFIPHGQGHVLITSRNPSWGERAQAMQIDVFLRRESIDHLNLRVPTMRPEDANHIAELLGDLPIAIAAAAAWLADTGTDVQEYLRLIVTHGPETAFGTSGSSVERTWDLSLSRLKDRSYAAYRLFQLCAVLAPEIALDIIYSDELAACLRPFDPTVSERMTRGSLVQRISRLALLRIDQRGESDRARGGYVLVHRVLQHVVRSRMTNEEVVEAQLQVHRVLASIRPEAEVDDPATWPRFRILWPHLDVTGALDSSDEAVRRLFIDRVRYQWLIGDLVGGRTRAERAVEVWTSKLDSISDPAERTVWETQILHMQFQLGNILRQIGEFDESRDLNQSVLAAQTELLSGDHPHTLMTAGGLAADLRGLGRYQEALTLDVATYGSWLDIFGEDYPRTLAALNNLATCYRLLGDFRAARERDEVVQQRRRIVLGELHPRTLSSAANLARDIRDGGDYERALTLLRTTVTGCIESQGPDAFETLIVQNSLAISLRTLGEVADAVRRHEETYEQLNERFGPTNPETLSCRLSLALSRLSTGETERSERELQAVLSFYAEDLGENHPHTLTCMANLAVAQVSGENKTGALRHAKAAMDGLVDVLGDSHQYTLFTKMNYAGCLSENQQRQLAVELCAQAGEAMKPVLGPDHPSTLRSLANLALLSQPPGSKSQLAEAVERLVQRVGNSHPAVETLRAGRFSYALIDTHPF